MTSEAERALAGLSAAPSEPSRPRLVRQYEALAEVALTALQETDLDVVLDLAARRVQDALACDFVKIVDTRVSATGLQVRSGAGWPPGVVGEAEVSDGAGSMAGYTLQSGEPLLVEDLALERRFTPPPLLVEQGIRSAVSAVIEGEREPVGVLEADSRTVGHFSASDIPVVQAYANVLSIVIRQREREQMSADFAAIASHELRTPLTLLIGYSSRLLRQLDERGTISREHREELEILHSESLRLRRATDIYLALGELERLGPRLQVREVDLLAIVRAAVAEVRLRYPAALVRIDCDRAGLPWRSDEVSVGRIVGNLVENGIKYSPEGAEIDVELSDGSDGATISVSDRCGGLSEADLRRLFQRSFRGDHGSDERSGLGLGLYVAQRLTEHVGGRLDARNADDGCIFTLHLPSTLPAEA